MDQSTPRGALKVLTNAMNHGETAGLRGILLASDPTETKMVDALISQQEASTDFRNAVAKSFGPDGTHALIGDLDAEQAEAMLALDTLPEKVDGDSATIGDAEQQVLVKKVNGKWMIPVKSLATDTDPETVKKIIANMSDRSRVLHETASEINTGKYKTPDDAGKALQAKLMQQAMDQATTQPATTQTIK